MNGCRRLIKPGKPALALAPMDGVTDAPMRVFLGSWGAFSYAVSEFLRVSVHPLPARVFRRDVPELASGAKTCTGMPVQVQILGGDPERMALSALAAVEAGAREIDINFGCPAPTVNRNDGGASLLKDPCRIRDVVAAVRGALPPQVPVSAKLRLGWDDIDAIDENAAMAAEGGADWLTVHARTRTQGYLPPVYWGPVGRVRRSLAIPVVANGDIWTLDDFRRCRDETGCEHFMVGRGAFANPALPAQIAHELGLTASPALATDWASLFCGYLALETKFRDPSVKSLLRLKQWAKLANQFGSFPAFDKVKRAENLDEFFGALELTPV